MNKLLVALVLLGLIVFAFAHKHKHHDDKDKDKHHDDNKHEENDDDDEDKHHEKDKHHQLRVCHYKATDGSDYDLRLMNRSSRPLTVQDPTTHGYVYFRPCRSVSIPACDPNSAVCFVEPSGKAINFGSAQEIQWADGVEGGANIEATYSNGELCSDGIPRKTVVEYKCTLQKPAPGVAPVANSAVALESRIVSAEISPCFIKLVIESPHACPTEEYCHSISLEAVCVSATQGLCAWTNKGHCVAVEEDCGRWRHASPVQIMAMVTLLTLFTSLCLGLCCCACRAARRSRRRACHQMKKESEKMTQELQEIPEQEQQPEQASAPQYQPVPIFYPGQQIPMSPYSMQGYPVIQFMGTPQQTKTEESA